MISVSPSDHVCFTQDANSDKVINLAFHEGTFGTLLHDLSHESLASGTLKNQTLFV